MQSFWYAKGTASSSKGMGVFAADALYGVPLVGVGELLELILGSIALAS